jgi:hypothetical protein
LRWQRALLVGFVAVGASAGTQQDGGSDYQRQKASAHPAALFGRDFADAAMRSNVGLELRFHGFSFNQWC